MTSFYFSDTPTRALIAKVVQAANEVAKRRGGYVGRTAMQKILYFLQHSGVPLPYRFELYNYGPFCSDIYTDVENLKADGVIVDDSGKSKYSNYVPADKLDALLDRHQNLIAMHSKAISAVVEVLVPLEVKKQELIATLDYIYRQEIAKNPEGPVKRHVIRRFVDVKGDSCGNRAEIEGVYSIFEKAKLFNP